MRRLLYPLKEWDIAQIERDYEKAGDYGGLSSHIPSLIATIRDLWDKESDAEEECRTLRRELDIAISEQLWEGQDDDED